MQDSKVTFVPVIFFFLLVSILYSWPLLPNLDKAIAYTYSPPAHYENAQMFPGDHLQSYYHLGLLRDAVEGKIGWFSNPYEFATSYTKESGPSTYFLPFSILSIPLLEHSIQAGYNLLILLSLFFGGLSAYLFTKRVTGSVAGGLAGGLLFDTVPVRLAELYGGHPSGFALFLFPLTLYFFDKALFSRSFFYSALAGICSVALAYQYLFFSYFLLILLLPYSIFRLVPAIKDAIKTAQVKKLIVASIPFLVGIGFTLYAGMSFDSGFLGGSTSEGGRSMAEIALFSPPVKGAIDRTSGMSVYLGYALLLLPFSILIAFILRKRGEREGTEILFFVSVFIISYWLAFGVSLDKYVPIYSFFYDHFPYFSLSRTPAKIMVVGIFAISVLAGYIVKYAWQRGLLIRIAAGLLIALIAFDFHPDGPIGLTFLDKENRVYADIAKDGSDDNKVLNLPIWPGDSAWSSIYQFYAIESGTYMINGYSPLVAKQYIDNIFWPLVAMNSGAVGKKEIDLLKREGVRWVVFHEEAYPPKVSAMPPRFALDRLKKSPWLKLVKESSPLTLFRLRDKALYDEGQDLPPSPIAFLFESERLARINGVVAEDKTAHGGYALVPDRSGTPHGFLNAGPYVSLPAGDYSALFRVKLLDGTKPASTEPILTLDVAGDKGHTILASRSLAPVDFENKDVYKNFRLDFRLAKGKVMQVEFRSILLKMADLYIDSVYLYMTKIPDPVYKLEAEDLFHTGSVVTIDSAKGVLSVPGKDPADVIIRGAGRLYPKGKYRATLRIENRGKTTAGEAGEFQIDSPTAGKTIASKTVRLEETGAGKLSDIVLEYELKEEEQIDFTLIGYGFSPLFVDKIVVEKLD